MDRIGVREWVEEAGALPPPTSHGAAPVYLFTFGFAGTLYLEETVQKLKKINQGTRLPVRSFQRLRSLRPMATKQGHAVTLW